jgi:hypothetical protein
MITVEKLKLYQYYDGDIDAFGHGTKRDRKMINDNEFTVIEHLIQDIKLVQKGLASSDYEKELIERLEEKLRQCRYY